MGHFSPHLGSQEPSLAPHPTGYKGAPGLARVKKGGSTHHLSMEGSQGHTVEEHVGWELMVWSCSENTVSHST